jgi:hypothetical protein
MEKGDLSFSTIGIPCSSEPMSSSLEIFLLRAYVLSSVPEQSQAAAKHTLPLQPEYHLRKDGLACIP